MHASIDIESLVLLLLKNYGEPLEWGRLHACLRKASEELGLNLSFYGDYSPELERKLERMVEKGLVKVLYVIGPHYMELYKRYLALTKDSEKHLEVSVPESVEMVIKKCIDVSREVRSEVGEQG